LTTPPIAAGTSATNEVRFEVSPNPAFIDDELSVRVHGLAPAENATLRATTEDDDKRLWSSHANFSADAWGTVVLTSAESLGGTYRGVSPMGLFWSMRLDDLHADGRAIFAKKDASPNRVSLEIEAAGRIVASAQIERIYLAPGTETRDLKVPGEPGSDSEDLVEKTVRHSVEHTIGRLFIPPAARFRRPCPVVVVLSGSGGGFDLDKAAVLARHGFATLALAYFGVPPLPTWLHRIPLEYFEAAFGWLAAQPEIDSQRIGVLAVSRGAELAFLLGSTFPQIRAVVAYAPSSVAWAAGGREKEIGELIPSWTYRATPVPFAPLPLRRFIFRSAISVALLKQPVMFRNLFRAGLRNSKAISAASIPVEKIRGPILLVSGGDDHLWPAAKMSEAIVARLKKHGFAYRVEHLHYPHAGHMLRYPFLPTTARDSRNPHLRNARYSFGGTDSADAEAQADSWKRAVEFLNTSLQ
jgi:dienelactone hydrolase